MNGGFLVTGLVDYRQFPRARPSAGRRGARRRAQSPRPARRTTRVGPRRPRPRTWTSSSASVPSWATSSSIRRGRCPTDGDGPSLVRQADITGTRMVARGQQEGRSNLDGKTKGPKMDVATIVVQPVEGRSVWLGGMGVVFKVAGADTGGAFAVVEHPIEPGRLVLPHVHLREDEYSYVLEGTIGARVGDQEVTAGPGSYLFKPRGLMHTV